MTLDLYGMTFSPYSEKARWALDHHQVEYTWHEHVPMLGEMSLRWRAGSLGKKASVPLAIAGREVLRDSSEIARHAEKAGKGAPLFVDDAACRSWDERGAAALGAGRVLVLVRSLADQQALRDSLPRWMPPALRSMTTPLARSGTRFVLKKYGGSPDDCDAAVKSLRESLVALRAALGTRSTLLSDFSYADVSMAAVMQMVSPVGEEFIRLGDARRRAWTEPTLAREFADLVDWRDALYARHRGKRGGKRRPA